MKGMTILKKRVITSREIFDKTMQYVAPLPCQQAYIRQLASILALHVNKNILLDDGYTPDALPTASAIVVAPTGTGKTYLLIPRASGYSLLVKPLITPITIPLGSLPCPRGGINPTIRRQA